MLKSSVFINKNDINIPKIKNKKIIILSAIFVCGVIIGIATYKNINQATASLVKKLFEEYTNLRMNSDIINCFLYSTVIYFTVPVLVILFGLGVTGTALIYPEPLIAGFLTSFYSTFLIKSYEAKGFAYLFLIVLPSFALLISSLIFLCSSGLEMSSCITSLIMTENSQKTMTVKSYLKKCLKYFSAVIAASVLNCSAFKLFYDMILIV